MIFLFCFSECIVLFFSPSMIGIIFMLAKFPGNESFRFETSSPLSICLMFNFSIIVIKKLWNVLAAFVRSFKFSSFASKLGTCSTECI